MNDIHRWGENDQHPLVRMFLTRAGALACAAVEIGACVKASIHLSVLSAKASAIYAAKVGHFAFPSAQSIAKYALKPINQEQIKETFRDLCYLIAGFASTLFAGVIFSPAINFHNHLYLGLVADDLAVKRERETAARLAAEATISELNRARAERYDLFTGTRDRQRAEELEKNKVDSRLADLLCPSVKAT